ncbi:MAG TPA: tRNA (adenosine(37)-N6)-dimethylallyltransferase MiaA [Verrucomicrobiae bacterium]|nr:tRNA (adenosine(37)-N6)-dimethylallyltransferase MiaA [Verrucomicrobiae bacterium]
MKPKVVIVLGPTAVGKSEVALALAESLNGEIINADSQQVYRYMDIGTGKLSMGERERVPHHLIDIVDPDGEFNAAQFRRLASEAIREISERKRNVIVCGGTGLYLKALTQGLFEGPGQDPAIRRALESEIAERGLASLYRRLENIDPTVSSSIHPNDRQRVIRALEIYQLTGKPLSQWQGAHGFQENPFAVRAIGLNRERAELYDFINRRSEEMVRDGFLEEVRGLVHRGFGPELKPLQSVGYRQMVAVLEGRLTMAEGLAEMRQETRRLAKRQLTWFRRDETIQWFHPERQLRQICETVSEFLDQHPTNSEPAR